MEHGYYNPPPTVHATGVMDDEPLFTSPPEERAASMRRPPQQTQQMHSTFGAPPMGEPSEPSAHPDNIFAATQSLTRHSEPAAPAAAGGGLARQPSGSFPKPSGGGLGRQPSGAFDAGALGGGGGGGLARQPSGSLGGLRRQPSGAYDASTASKTDKSFFHSTPTAPGTATAPGSQPGLIPPTTGTTPAHTTGATPAHTTGTTPAPSTIPVGNAPSSPYTKTEEVPPSGTSPMNVVMENFNKYMTKAEGLAGNIWSHMKTGPSVTDAARGRVSQGIKLVQEGGFEGLYKSTFGAMEEGEQLRKTYACYLSTSTGPVAGTLYVSNLKFAFASDRPLAYKAETGLQAFSYYKMVVPLSKVKAVVPSHNEEKPLEKYIQVVTNDGHDFWFMGFVSYDKGVKNMQLALQHIGEIDPNGGLKAPWAGMSVPGMKKPAATTTDPAAAAAAHNPIPGGPAANHATHPTV